MVGPLGWRLVRAPRCGRRAQWRDARKHRRLRAQPGVNGRCEWKVTLLIWRATAFVPTSDHRMFTPRAHPFCSHPLVTLRSHLLFTLRSHPLFALRSHLLFALRSHLLFTLRSHLLSCLLYTSDAADEGLGLAAAVRITFTQHTLRTNIVDPHTYVCDSLLSY